MHFLKIHGLKRMPSFLHLISGLQRVCCVVFKVTRKSITKTSNYTVMMNSSLLPKISNTKQLKKKFIENRTFIARVYAFLIHMYMCTYIYTYTYICSYFARVYVYVCICTYVRTNIHVSSCLVWRRNVILENFIPLQKDI